MNINIGQVALCHDGGRMAVDAKTRALPLLNGMTVAEVYEKLAAFHPSTLVVVRGELGGFNCLAALRPVPLRLNVNAHDGFGKHEIPGPGERPDVIALAFEEETEAMIEASDMSEAAGSLS